MEAGDGLSTAAQSVSITVSNVSEATNAVDDAYVLLGGSTLTAGPDAGVTQFYFDNLTSAIEFVRAGKLRALGLTSAERKPPDS